MAGQSDTQQWLFTSLDIVEGYAQAHPVALPPVGAVRMYVDPTSGTLKCVDSNGLSAFPAGFLPDFIDGGTF